MAKHYQLSVLKTRHVAGVEVTSVSVTDKYYKPNLRVERTLVRALLNFLQHYLEAFPNVKHDSPFNIARMFVYLPSGMRAWREYMPDGMATHYVHNPENRNMTNGGRLDFITQRFFRHSYDATGVRSRAYVLSWLVLQHVGGSKHPVHWLSIAAGSGQPVYDVIDELSATERDNVSLMIEDVNEEILAFAKDNYKQLQPGVSSVKFEHASILDATKRDQLFADFKPTVIDAMGLFEYLSEKDSAELLRAAYAALPIGGMMIFTNMSPRHPHLELHKRGLGWPGVIQRTMHEVLSIMDTAGIPGDARDIYHAEDKIYNIYRIVKQ